ncbi:hypothetical protein CBL_10956 [Carabus blaptoides fortunei]
MSDLCIVPVSKAKCSSDCELFCPPTLSYCTTIHLHRSYTAASAPCAHISSWYTYTTMHTQCKHSYILRTILRYCPGEKEVNPSYGSAVRPQLVTHTRLDLGHTMPGRYKVQCGL